MANSFSDGKLKLIEPPYNSYKDEWDKPVNSNWGLIDAGMSGATTVNASLATSVNSIIPLVFPDFDTNPTPWMNPLSAQNLRLVITGSLLTNVTVTIPSGRGGFWLALNATSGPFSVLVKTTASGSTGVYLNQNTSTLIVSDGTNVYLGDNGTNNETAPSGIIVSYAGPNIPAGYLLCNGIAISRTTYAALFAAIGTTWGSGDGSTTFNIPDLMNLFTRGASSAAPVGTYESSMLKTHTHLVNDPGHAHTYQQPIYPSGTASGGPSPTVGIASASTNLATTGITVENTGGFETRPENKRVYYMIKI